LLTITPDFWLGKRVSLLESDRLFEKSWIKNF